MTKPKFRFEDYPGEDMFMQCETEEQAENFCRAMHEDGRKWLSGESYLDETNWAFYDRSTVYWFNRGIFTTMYNIQKEFTDEDIEKHMLKYTDFDWDDHEPKKIKKEPLLTAITNKTPCHYKILGMDMMEFILELVEINARDKKEACLLFNVYKYIFRFGRKNGDEDLEKAEDYYQRFMEYREGRDND